MLVISIVTDTILADMENSDNYRQYTVVSMDKYTYTAEVNIESGSKQLFHRPLQT